MTARQVKSIFARALSDERVFCRLMGALVLLALLGVDVPRAWSLLAGTTAGAAPRSVALEWKEGAPDFARECRPVFEDGRGWRLACRMKEPSE